MDDETFTTVLNVLRGIVCFVGIAGNLTAIFVVIVLREYHKDVTHWYVLQLAVADLFLLVTIPFKIVEDHLKQWMFSNGLCKAKETMFFINYYSSVLFLTVMSADRYIAVCHGFSTKLQKLRTKQASSITTLLIWIICLLFCIPIMLYSSKIGCMCQYRFPAGNNHDMFPEFIETYDDDMEIKCEHILDNVHSEDLWNYSGEDKYSDTPTAISETFQERNSNDTIYNMGCSYAMSELGYIAYILFNFIFMFIIPCMIISISYSLIAARLKKRRTFRRALLTERSGSTNSSNGGERKRFKSAASIKIERSRLQVTNICLFLVISFVTCWLPFHVIHLAKMKGIEGSAEHCKRLASTTSLAAYLNSALNPYIYNFIGRRFIRRFRLAVGFVRSSIKRGASTLSSKEVALTYKAGKKNDQSTAVNSATVTTKFGWKE